MSDLFKPYIDAPNIKPHIEVITNKPSIISRLYNKVFDLITSIKFNQE